MAINKKLIHFNTFENFNSKKLSANIENTKYTLGIDGEIQTGSPDILYLSIVYIKDTKQQWTHGLLYTSDDNYFETKEDALSKLQEAKSYTDNKTDDIKLELNKKQDALVSGTNIKTVNGQSLLGNGDLEIQGLKTYTFDYVGYGQLKTITQEELNEILESDKIYIKNGNTLVEITVKNESDSGLFLIGYNNYLNEGYEYRVTVDKFNLYYFIIKDSVTLVTDSEVEDLINAVFYSVIECPYIEDGLVLEGQYFSLDLTKITMLTVWVEELSKVFYLRSNASDLNSIIFYGKYTDDSLLKATYNQENQTLTFNIIEQSGGNNSSGGAYALIEHGTNDTTFTLTPNTFHVWDEVTNLTLTLGNETSGIANEYLFQFTSGTTATTLSLPSNLKWANDSAPTIKSNMIYQVSILKGLASVLEFKNTIVFPIIGSNTGYSNEEYAKVYEYFVNTYNLTSTPDSPYNGVFITETLICNDPSVGGPVIKVSLNNTRLLLWTENAIDYISVPSINNLGEYSNYIWD